MAERVDLDALEQNIRQYRNVGSVMDWQHAIALIQRLREAEALVNFLADMSRTLAEKTEARLGLLERVCETAIPYRNYTWEENHGHDGKDDASEWGEKLDAALIALEERP